MNSDGTITYTPRRGYIGQDRLTYLVDDLRGGTDEAVVTINVARK